MTDDRPQPKYGQYAPIPPTPVAEPAPVVVAPVPPAPSRTRDVVVTTVLLLFGVFDVVTGFSQFAHLGDALIAAYTAQGFGTFTSIALADSMGLGINIARVAILVLVTVAALLRIARGKAAFWIPLLGAVASVLVIVVCVLVVVIHDPALAAYVAQQQTTAP